MTVPLIVTLTDAGRAALVDAEAGTTVAVTIAEVGLTDTAFIAAPTLTEVPGEFKRLASVSGASVGADTIHLVIRDSSDDLYEVTGLGLYLEDGTLFGSYSQDDAILGKHEVTTFLLAADLKFLPGQAELVQFGDTNFLNPPATEDTAGVAAIATLAEVLAGLVDDKIITPAKLSQTLASFVALTALGTAGGVATLGPDGKLLAAQRPPIDLVDVFPVESEVEMLALAAAGPGDMAVRTDTGLVYILQATPASDLANWILLNTPAPVSSVNGKAGAVQLVPADLGAVPTARTVTVTGGILTGGGSLDANRSIGLQGATTEEALGGSIGDKVVTPHSLGAIIDILLHKVSDNLAIFGGGAATGGGSLTTNRTIDVPIATVAEILAGSGAGVLTADRIGQLGRSFTPNGYARLPAGLIIQGIRFRTTYTAENDPTLNWPIAFPNACLWAAVTPYINARSLTTDLWAQICGQPTATSIHIQFQSDDNSDRRIDGADIIGIGW